MVKHTLKILHHLLQAFKVCLTILGCCALKNEVSQRTGIHFFDINHWFPINQILRIRVISNFLGTTDVTIVTV